MSVAEEHARFGSRATSLGNSGRRFGTLLSNNVSRTTTPSKQGTYKRVRVRRPTAGRKQEETETGEEQKVKEKIVTFLPGPVGLQLEPAPKGAKVVRFVDGGPNNPGQARKSGSIQPGDLVVRAESAYRIGVSYEEIINILKKSHTVRELRVQSSWDRLIYSEDKPTEERKASTTNETGLTEESSATGKKTLKTGRSSRKKIERTPLAQAEYNLRRDPPTPSYLASMPSITPSTRSKKAASSMERSAKSSRNAGVSHVVAHSAVLLDCLAEMPEQETAPSPEPQNGPIIVPLKTPKAKSAPKVSSVSSKTYSTSGRMSTEKRTRVKLRDNSMMKSTDSKKLRKEEMPSLFDDTPPKSTKSALKIKTPAAPLSRFDVDTPLMELPTSQETPKGTKFETVQSDMFSPANVKRISSNSKREDTRRPLARVLETLYDSFIFSGDKDSAVPPSPEQAASKMAVESPRKEALVEEIEQEEVLVFKDMKRTVLKELEHAKVTLNATNESSEEMRSTVDELFRENAVLRQNFQKRIQQARVEHTKTEQELKALYATMLGQRENRIEELNNVNTELKSDLKQAQDRFFSEIGREIAELQEDYGMNVAAATKDLVVDGELESQFGPIEKTLMDFQIEDNAKPQQSKEKSDEHSKMKEENEDLRMQLDMAQTLVRELEGQILISPGSASQPQKDLVDTHQVEMEQKEENIVSLKEDLNMLTSELESNKKIVESTKTENEALHEKIQDSSLELSNSRKAESTLRDDLQYANQQLEEAREEVDATKSTLLDNLEAQKEVARLAFDTEKEDLLGQISEAQLRVKQMERKAARAMTNSFAFMKLTASLESEREATTLRLEEALNKIQEITDKYNSKISDEYQQQETIAKQEAELKQKHAHMEELTSTLATKTEIISRLTCEVQRSKDNSRRNIKAISAHESESKSMKRNIVDLESTLTKLGREKASLQFSKQQLEERNKSLLVSLEGQYDEISSLKGKVSDIKNQTLAGIEEEDQIRDELYLTHGVIDNLTEELKEIEMEMERSNVARQAIELKNQPKEVGSAGYPSQLRLEVLERNRDRRERVLDSQGKRIRSLQRDIEYLSAEKVALERNRDAAAKLGVILEVKIFGMTKALSKSIQEKEQDHEEKEYLMTTLLAAKEEFEAKIANMEKKSQELAKLSSEREETLVSVDKTLLTNCSQFEALEHILKETSNTITDQLHQQRILEKQKAELESRMEELLHSYKKAEQELQEVTSKNEELQHENSLHVECLAEMHRESEEKHGALDVQEKENMRLRAELQSLSSRKDSVSSEVDYTLQSLETLKQDHAVLETSAMKREAELKSRIWSAESSLMVAQKRCVVTEIEQRAGFFRMDELQSEISILRKEVQLSEQDMKAKDSTEIELARLKAHTELVEKANNDLEAKEDELSSRLYTVEGARLKSQKRCFLFEIENRAALLRERELETEMAGLTRELQRLQALTEASKEKTNILEHLQKRLEGLNVSAGETVKELASRVSVSEDSLLKAQKQCITIELEKNAAIMQAQDSKIATEVLVRELKQSEADLKATRGKLNEFLDIKNSLGDIRQSYDALKSAHDDLKLSSGKRIEELMSHLSVAERSRLETQKRSVAIEVEKKDTVRKFEQTLYELQEHRGVSQRLEGIVLQAEKAKAAISEKVDILEMMNDALIEENNQLKDDGILTEHRLRKNRCMHELVLRSHSISLVEMESSLRDRSDQIESLKGSKHSMEKAGFQERGKIKEAIESLARLINETAKTGKRKRTKLETRLAELTRDLLQANAKIASLQRLLNPDTTSLHLGSTAENTDAHEKLLLRTANLTLTQSKTRAETSSLKASVDALEDEKLEMRKRIAELEAQVSGCFLMSTEQSNSTSSPPPNKEIILLRDLLANSRGADNDDSVFQAGVQVAFLKEEMKDYKDDLKIILTSLLADIKRQRSNGPAILRTVERLTALACLVEGEEGTPPRRVTSDDETPVSPSSTASPSLSEPTPSGHHDNASAKVAASAMIGIFKQREMALKAKAFRKWSCYTAAAKSRRQQKEASTALSNELKTTQEKLGNLKSHLKRRRHGKADDGQRKLRLRSVLMTRSGAKSMNGRNNVDKSQREL